MRKNYKITLSYDGTRYLGWEKQKNSGQTIQGKLETVLTKMTDSIQPVNVIGAGRTDAGVHAKAMVCNASFETSLSPLEIKNCVNHYLPDDICVTDIHEASGRFHSRYNATGKTYCYTCYAGNNKPVFNRKYVYTLNVKPDIALMKAAAEFCIGTHDFKCFCANSKMKKSTVRTIYSIRIIEKNGYIFFYYNGNGFLYHMVRILTGTLLEIGFHKKSVDDMQSILHSRDRSNAGFTAPAQGLCLESVDYS